MHDHLIRALAYYEEIQRDLVKAAQHAAANNHKAMYDGLRALIVGTYRVSASAHKLARVRALSRAPIVLTSSPADAEAMHALLVAAWHVSRDALARGNNHMCIRQRGPCVGCDWADLVGRVTQLVEIGAEDVRVVLPGACDTAGVAPRLTAYARALAGGRPAAPPDAPPWAEGTRFGCGG